MAEILKIKVIPQSGRQACILDESGTIKCYLKSPPEKGKANKELVAFLAKKLNIPKHDLEIISGALSRNKLVKIHRDICLDEIKEIMHLDRQKKIF